MGGIIGSILGTAAPVLGTVLGGPVGGAIGGFAGSAINGGSFGQDLLGAGLGGLGGAISGTQGSLFAPGGLLEGTGLSGLNSSILGAAGSLGDGLSGLYQGTALQSGVDGIKSGFSSIGDGLSDAGSSALKGFGFDTAGTSQAGSLGGGSAYGSLAGGTGYDSLAGTALADSPDKLKSFLPDGFSLGNSGISDAATSVGSAPVASSSGFGRIGSSLLSAGLGVNANNDAQKAIQQAQEKNSALLTPFLNQSFDASNLANDPGYQFQLQQGTNALNNAAAARGGFYSGQALTDAANFNKGLTDTTLNDAYTRYLQNQGQKLGAAGALAGFNDASGNAAANAGISNSNVLSQSLASALGGSGFGNAGQSLGGNDLSSLLAQLRYKQALAGGSIY